MSRETWTNIKNSKSFYIRTYRIGLKSVLISLTFNILCALAIYYLYFHQPVRAYYATNGETPPVPLNPLDQPNFSTIPLLEADPIEDDSEKLSRNSEEIMAQDALAAVALRNKFYRDGQRKAMLALLFSIFINFILASLLVYMLTHPPAPKYFATSISGRITPLYPLDQPNQSDSAVLQWANQAAIAAFTYNFVNYRDELQASSGFFTPDGWTQFLNALQQSNNLDAVKAKKLIVSAVATRAPIILQKGLLNGVYSWRVQMPILVTYQSASEFSQQNNVVTMLVTRVSTLNSPRGIGIAQFVVGPASGGVS